MGCGGSKEEVATTNTIATKPKQNNNTNPSTAGNTETPKEKSVEKTTVVTSSNVKDIAVNDEGKMVAKESPDRYFSSRKDDISIEIESGNGYHTPFAEGNGTPRGETPTKVDVKEKEKEKEKEKGDNNKDINLEGAQEVEKNSKIAESSIAKTENGEESKTVKETLPKTEEKKEEKIPEKKETEKDESKSTSA